MSVDRMTSARFGLLTWLASRVIRSILPAKPRKRPVILEAIVWGQWVIVPALVFMALGRVTKNWNTAQLNPEASYWRTKSWELARLPKVDGIFVGSSRVAASIDEEAFGKAVSEKTGQHINCVNIGVAWTTVQTQYLYLRNLLRSNPEKYRGVTVFIECPGNLPVDPATWTTPWHPQDRFGMLTSVMTPKDVASYWFSGPTLEDSCRLTFNYAVRKYPFVANRDSVGRELIARGTRWADAHVSLPALKQLAAEEAKSGSNGESKPSKPAADLSTKGGIRVEEEHVRAAREFAKRIAAQKASSPLWPFRVPENAVLVDIISMVKEMNGRVVFFEMPLHEVQAEEFKTEVRKQDAAEFAKQCDRWQTRLIRANITTVDDDFPDIWHMRKSLAPEYSRKLAEATIEAGISLGREVTSRFVGSLAAFRGRDRKSPPQS